MVERNVADAPSLTTDVGRERNQHPLDVDTKRVYTIADEIHMG